MFFCYVFWVLYIQTYHPEWMIESFSTVCGAEAIIGNKLCYN
jgi:hypothetical protein